MKIIKTYPIYVLCLVDDLKDADLFQEMLHDSGFLVKMDIVSNEEQFISSLKASHYDVILADYSLSGYDVAASFKQATILRPEIPFICVSDTITEDRAIELLRQGATDYVLKDRIGRLAFAVQGALEKSETKKDWKKAQVQLQTKEDEIKKSELRYKYMFQNNPQPMWIFDQETLRFLEVNHAATENYGYSRQEFLSMTLKDIRPKEDLEALLKDIELTCRAHNSAGEWRHLKKNGELIYVEVVSYSIVFGEIQARHVMVTDITNRKSVEEALRESEDQLKAIFENSLNPIMIADDAGNYLKVNQAAAKLFQYPVEQLLQMNVGDLRSSTLPDATARYQEYINNGREIGEFHILHPDGTEAIAQYHAVRVRENFNLSILSDITESKKVEEALRESEARFRTIFEIASLGIIQVDPKDGKIILVNNYFETITGYRTDELLKMTFNELTHPDDREKDWEIFSKAARGEVEYRNEKRYVKKDGNIVWVRIHLAFIKDEKGRPIRTVAICEDITEQKEAERNIALATQQLKHHIENSPLAVIEWDENFKIKRWTAHAEEFFGWSEAEVLNKFPGDWRFVHKDDTQEVNSTMGSLLSGDVKKNISLNRNYAKDGGIVHCVWFNSALVDENGKLLSILSLVHNVTERKHAEDELIKLSRAVEQSPVSIIITDINGNIEYVNAKALALSGYELEELKGKNPRIFSLGKKSKEEYRILWETILSGKEWRGELQNKKKNGEHFWEFASISAIKNKMGHITHFLAVKEDITEQKQAERNLQELEIARKTARFKQNFLANMSHEIRTPLTGVLGMIEILELTPLNEDQKDYVNTIKASGENLKEIINQVLDYSKIEAGKIQINPVDFEFQTVLQNAEMLYRNITRSGVKVIIHLDPAIPGFIRTDKSRLSQVVNNLVSNALKFTHEGSVSVQARLLTQIEETQLVKIEIKVVDTGIGIPAHLQKKLFSPFSQIDDNDTRYYEGTGLGLSICKELAGLLGGEIGLQSVSKKGSSFWFSFTAQVAEYQQELASRPHEYANLQNLHIMLTEDKVVNQKVVSLMLKSLGHTVTIANNGAQAIELYESGKFDLILMDIQMPVMNGIKSTQILKERFTDLPPVIGLSANAFEGDREKYMALGMDEYLAKPVKREDFQKVLQHFFASDREAEES